MVEAQTSGLPCVISDKVPGACILEEDLVSVLQLSDNAKTWAAHIISCSHTERTNRAADISAKGFDSTTNAKWLEDYYCSHSRSI